MTEHIPPCKFRFPGDPCNCPMDRENVGLTPEQKTAAYLVYLFACLAYGSPGTKRNFYAQVIDWWDPYQTRTGEHDKLTRAALWAMRMEQVDPEDDWVGYVEYKMATGR